MLRNPRYSRFEDYLGWDVTIFLLSVCMDVIIVVCIVVALLWAWSGILDLLQEIREKWYR